MKLDLCVKALKVVKIFKEFFDVNRLITKHTKNYNSWKETQEKKAIVTFK